MKNSSKQRIHLTLNSILTILTLFALIISIVAWFSTNKYANIDTIEIMVDRKEIQVVEYPKSILLPCATKFDDVTPSDFNAHCVVLATYVLQGDVDVVVEVDNDNGVLGYVLGNDETSDDYYSIISSAIDQYKQSHEIDSPYTYNDLRKALKVINRRRVGTLNDQGNTVIKIVYWADYNYFGTETLLNKITNGIYTYEALKFDVNVTFIT